MADAHLKRLIREVFEDQIRRAQPRGMTVSRGTADSSNIYMLNPLGNAADLFELPIRWTGQFDLNDGDKVLVSGIGNNLTILAHTYNATDDTFYPRQRFDRARAPSGEMYLYADGGHGLVLNETEGKIVDDLGADVVDFLNIGRVKVSANDTTPDELDSKLVAGTSITLTENNDGGNETLTIAVDDPTDADAIHDNVGGEIAAVTEKASPVSADLLLIEDSEASNIKKRVQVGNLPGGGGTDDDAIHDNVDGEIDAIGAANPLAMDDVLIAESEANSYAKVKTTLEYLLSFGGLHHVKNNSGGTASSSDVGFMQYDATDGYEYVTTTTAGDVGDWCVVTEGGADGDTIYVVRHGFAVVAYAGGAPSKGDYLITSTTAGSAAAQSYVSPAIFAVCTSAGGGGFVFAHLLTDRRRRPLTDGDDILRINAASDFSVDGWSGNVNDGAPTSSPVTVSTSSGALGSITPVSSSEHGKIVLHNLTRGNSTLIESISGNDITFVDDTPLSTWQNGDSLTALSQTITGSGAKYRDIDLSQSIVLPELTVEIGLAPVWRDTGDIENLTTHPYEAYNTSKTTFIRGQVVNIFMGAFPSVPIINRYFGVGNSASGGGTGLLILRFAYIVVAAP